ncbi:MAG: sulfatase-like hydrolase/transferase [Chloroflexi bacterium]|nr:sulfatase-like hydrolase/transferase [Chloroflexota bacterium]
MTATTQTDSRPRNMLFVWTDEQRPDTIGAYGNPRIRTPNLDRLAQDSVLFEQAYCAIPVCTPSRATVLTGVYPHTHRATHNNIPLPDDVPTIAELLRAHSFIGGYAGKWHLGREIHPQRGFDAWWSSMEDGYTKDHKGEGFSTYHHWLVKRGYEPPDRAPDGSRLFSRSTAARLPEEAGKPAFLAEEACRFLDTHGHQPFALYVNFLEPHMPFFGPWDDMYEAEAMELHETWYRQPDAGMPLRHRLRREGYATKNPHVNTNNEAGWKALKARYWGLASLVDKYCGRILDHLETLGLAENTIVVYSTDHGDMMGEHRLVAKGVQYEGASRVPLIMRIPGVEPKRITTPVSQIDVLPTLLDALGVDAPAHVQGTSLLPLMREGDTAPDEAVIVFEWSGAHGGVSADGQRVGEGAAAMRAMAAQQRTIRRGRWKLTVDEIGDHELYDLVADPGETRNLLYRGPGREPLAEVLAAARDLWERLRAWQARTGDTLSLPSPV